MGLIDWFKNLLGGEKEEQPQASVSENAPEQSSGQEQDSSSNEQSESQPEESSEEELPQQ